MNDRKQDELSPAGYNYPQPPELLYPCGCRATCSNGPETPPEYCPEHGHSERLEGYADYLASGYRLASDLAVRAHQLSRYARKRLRLIERGY